MVFSLSLTLATYVFVVVTGYRFQCMEQVLLYFFQNFRFEG